MKKTILLFSSIILIAIGVHAQSPIPVNLEIVTTPLTLGDLPMTAGGQQVWGDYNNDGQIDMFMATGQGSAFSALYKNNGNGTFTEQLTDITMLALASAVFFDYDNDGNLDLMIAGSVDGTNTAVITELYKNSGAPTYSLTLVETASFVGISAEGGDNNTRLLEAVDYNNDGWVDVFLSGNAGGTWEVSQNSRVVALYKNNQGSFELQTTPVGGTENFVSMNGGGIHCGDVNNDGFADMIVSGYVDGDVQTVTDLYINAGNGSFTYFADSRTLFTGHTQGESFFADINNDGWLDIVEIGRDVNNGWASFANLFINNKNLTFTMHASGTTGLIGGGAVVAVGDINNDGKVDLAASGWGPNTSFFYNKGDNTFMAKAIDPDKARARAGCINFVDFTKDGNLDFTIFGYRDGGDGTPENPSWPDFLLKNNLAEGISTNLAPSVPANFKATANGNDVVLTWDKATDDTTPADAIRYNVYAKSKDGSKTYMYFPSNSTNGLLAASGVRPFISGTTITLKGIAAADYEFGVQAIDNANLGGNFSSVFTAVNKLSTKMMVAVYGYQDKITITNSQNERVLYTILNAAGQVISKGFCNPLEKKEINLSQKGVCLVKVSGNQGTKVEKVTLF
jgi:hypothetical protein